MQLTVEFVTFHVALGLGESVHPNQTLAHLEYLSNIEMMLRSARMHHPQMLATILTDARTDFSGLSVPFTRFNSEVSKSSLMLDRTRAQLRYVQSSRFDVPIVLLDSDILVNGNLNDLFAKDFDVALTWREHSEMPINGGFMVLNNRRSEVSKKFFEQFFALYADRYAGKADWFGDQYALCDMVGLTHEQMIGQVIVTVNGYKILLLPCDKYNFSPANKYKAISSGLSDKFILHFKGNRKRLMPIFYNAWLRTGMISKFLGKSKLLLLCLEEKARRKIKGKTKKDDVSDLDDYVN